MRRALPDLSLAALLAALGGLVYHPALDLWLTYDDFFHLHYLYTSTPAEYLLDPEVWQRLPFKMVTPLLFLSFDLDLALFGLDAHAFLVHQLVSFALCAAAFYLVLRLWLAPAWSAFATVLFILGPVTVSIAPLLMVRHYVETTLLCLIAVGLYVLAARGRGMGLALVSAVVYLLAMLAKEIAVPLVFLLVLLPLPVETTLRRRLSLAVPHAAAFVLYLAYRFYMLGTMTGGYGWLVDSSDLPRLALLLPVKIGAELLGQPSAASWAMLIALLAGLGIVLFKGREMALLVAISVLLALLPILPVSTEMVPRYALPAWFIVVLAFPFAVRDLVKRGGAVRLAGLGLAVIAAEGVLLAHLDAREATFARVERMSAENRAFLEMGPGDFLRTPLSPPATMGELAWLKTDLLEKKPGAGWFYDDLFVCMNPGLGRVWTWDPAQRRVEDMTASLPRLQRRHCRAIRERAPLTVEMHAAGRTLHWTLGPYREGTYSFVLGDGLQAFPMPANGGFQLRRAAALSLRVKYRSPEGWTTYSPELKMDFTRDPSFRWARPRL
ncbi:MAG TPA: hypothetical protein VNM67_05480 [Thermoanaerobaculia bacterium]|jgi:hypothetical protein|nr:hypothetical protein [Thermoanaerobaculia bacterium]